jgi:hypothetical protein
MKNLFIIICITLFFTGCITSNAQKGAILGGLSGMAGSALGKGDRRTTVLYGTGGTLIGYLIGNEIDKNKQMQYNQLYNNYNQPVTECEKIVVRTMKNGQWVETIEERCHGRKTTNTY